MIQSMVKEDKLYFRLHQTTINLNQTNHMYIETGRTHQSRFINIRVVNKYFAWNETMFNRVHCVNRWHNIIIINCDFQRNVMC